MRITSEPARASQDKALHPAHTKGDAPLVDTTEDLRARVNQLKRRNADWYFAYVRISDKDKQEAGASLNEQPRVISDYAARERLRVGVWIVEKQSASKLGRPLFLEALELLKTGKAKGIIVHKIDRSARNMQEWGQLEVLLDAGVEVRSAADGIDTSTRPGRMMANILASMAADYSRNLRQEVYKGVSGRLRDGLWPWSAPLGYIDMGKGGKTKKVDGRLEAPIRRAFYAFSTGEYTLRTLRDFSVRIGLLTRNGKPLTKTKLHAMLTNPFYTGWMRETKTGELFKGRHRAIITHEVFEQVQRVLKHQARPRRRKHNFLFSCLLRCSHCPRHMVGELQKGNVYYRCHTPGCLTTSVREDEVTRVLRDTLADCRPHPHWRNKVLSGLAAERLDAYKAVQRQATALRLEQDNLRSRLDRLVDALVDGTLDSQVYTGKKNELELQLQRSKRTQAQLTEDATRELKEAEEKLELGESLIDTYDSADQPQKRQIVRFATSNLSVDGRTLVAKRTPALDRLSKPPDLTKCAHRRDATRTDIDTLVASTLELGTRLREFPLLGDL